MSAADRRVLLETEAREVVSALGLALPAQVVVRDAEDGVAIDAACGLPGEEVVVKVVAPGVIHKTELGGVARVAKTRDALSAALRSMAARVPAAEAFTVSERVAHEEGFGSELLFSVRFTADFGPVVIVAAGGVAAEQVTRELARGRELAVFTPDAVSDREIEAELARGAASAFATRSIRGQPPRVPLAVLRDAVKSALAFATRSCPTPYRQIELNPIVHAEGVIVALDAVVELGSGPTAPPRVPPGPRALEPLLRPESIALLGVPARPEGPGHVILSNILARGFNPERLWVVKAGHERLEGCPCVPTLAALAEPVDLLVVSLPAVAAEAAVEEAITREVAAAIIVIAGGFGERGGGRELERRLTARVTAARAAGGSVVLNGANCLGVSSEPGRFDATFVPRHKLPRAPRPAPLALVSQSGAVLISVTQKLWPWAPRYAVSVGNQTDLTVGDYMHHFADEADVEVVVSYVEGFAPLDGRRWLSAARRMVASGRAVVLHRAGRTQEAARAIASHTAAMAGDYAIGRHLAEAAGVLVTDTFEELEDLTRLCCAFAARPVRGRRLSGASNAGFECVALADHGAGLTLGPFEVTTQARLEAIVEEAGLHELVDVTNPLDNNPMLGDAGFVAVAEAILNDPGSDVSVIACVPMTAALTTLAPSEGHDEDLGAPGSVVVGLAELWTRTERPWVAVVDAGALYDPMAQALAETGLPVFRSADRAVRALARYVAWRLRCRG